MPATSLKAEVQTAFRFALVGGAATLTHLVMAQVSLAAGFATAAQANVAGFLLAFLVGLLGHYYFTFAQQGSLTRATWRYSVIAVAGFLVNATVLFVLMRVNRIDEAVSLAIAITIVPAGTFIASRLWGFTAS